MNLKSLILITICLLLTAYVIFVKVEEIKLISESSCKGNSCVRFCEKSSTKIKINENSTFEKLRSDYKPIQNQFCKDALELEDNSHFEFLENGHVRIGDDEILEWHNYCLNYTDENDYEIFECYVKNSSETIKDHYPYFMLLSVPFLIISIIIYCLVPQLRNLSGKCLLCYIICVLTLYLVHSFSLIFPHWISEHQIICELFGYIHFMTFLMCFLWLNILCFDVWSTVRKIYNTTSRSIFIKYSLYGFGLPFIITLLIFILNKRKLIPEDYQHFLGESIDESRICFIGTSLTQTKAQIIYIIIPLTIIVSINVIFYALTAYTIFVIQRESARIRNSEHDRYSQNKQKFYLYFRLFVIMGITWVAEVISNFIGTPNLFLSILSIANCLQGVIIFMHFIWRSRVHNSIRRKATSSATMATTENL